MCGRLLLVKLGCYRATIYSPGAVTSNHTNSKQVTLLCPPVLYNTEGKHKAIGKKLQAKHNSKITKMGKAKTKPMK